MISEENGVDHGPLAGWLIVVSNGLTMLGRPVDDPDGVVGIGVLSLSPVYRLVLESQYVPPQRPGDPHGRELAKNVEGCEQLIAAMRAQESGIVMPPPGARLPPPSRRQ